jgi:hypothetical protein
MMEAVSTSETSVSIHQIARRNIPENSHLHTVLGWFLRRFGESGFFFSGQNTQTSA